MAALSTSMGKIPEARMVQLGTRPASSGHPFERALKTSVSTSTKLRMKGQPIQPVDVVEGQPQLAVVAGLGSTAIRLEAKVAKKDPDALQIVPSVYV